MPSPVLRNMPESDVRQWIADVISDREDGFFQASQFTDSRILQVCVDEGVASLFRYHLKQQGKLDQLSEPLQQQLKTLDIQNIASQLARQTELAQLLRLFEKKSLKPLLLKGEALAQTLYPSAHLRTRCDTDLFFADKKTAEKAWKILEAQRYQRIPTMEGRFSGFQFACTRQLPSGITMELDIHNRINNYQWFSQRLSYDELIAESCLFAYPTPQRDHVNVAIVNPLYQLIHACVHRICNRVRQTENRLIWLYDIHLLYSNLTSGDRDKLVRVAHDKDLSGIILEGLNASVATFATPVEKQLLDRLSGNSRNETASFNPHGRRIHFYLQDWFQNKGFCNKLRHLMEKLFPPASYVREKYQVKNRYLLPWYYLKRILDVIIR